jgi:alpha,alpha-trehalase
VVQSLEDALRLWRDPDHGIWETRGGPQHFTFSKVMCWVALDRGARLARLRGEEGRASTWFAAAREIHDDVCERGVSADGVFTQSYGSSELDASLLVLPIVEFLPPDDPRVRATVVAIALGLSEGALVYRYRSAQVDDGMGGEPEGSFTVCSFWLVSALVAIGELDLARSHCERLITAASSLGLYAEEIDPVTGRHLGNYPQALTHLAMVDATLRVIRAERRGHETRRGPAGTTTWWNAAGTEDREFPVTGEVPLIASAGLDSADPRDEGRTRTDRLRYPDP